MPVTLRAGHAREAAFARSSASLPIDVAKSTVSTLLSLASRCDGHLIERMEANRVTSASHVTDAVATAMVTVQRCVPESVRNVLCLVKLKRKALEMEEEEVDAGLKTLAAFLHQIAVGDVSVGSSEDTLHSINRLLGACPGFTGVPIAITPARSDALRLLAASSHVSVEIDSNRSHVSLPWFMPNCTSSATITVFDGDCEPVHGVAPADVVIESDTESLGWSVSSVTVESNAVTLLIVSEGNCSLATSLRVDIGGSPFTIPLEVRRAACVCVHTHTRTHTRTL